MDCGPAALAALLQGLGRHVSYGRLREACQTDVSGTSIDRLEEIAVALGVDAEQAIVPVDSLLSAEADALPAIVVVDDARGSTHFVVVWRCKGGRVETMDPARGRQSVPVARFLERVHVHEQRVDAAAWCAWSRSAAAAEQILARLRRLDVARDVAGGLFQRAATAPSWHAFADLDAAVRMVGALRASRAIGKSEGARLVTVLVAQAEESRRCGRATPIPEAHYAAAATAEEGTIVVRGAVVLSAHGLRPRDAAIEQALCPELLVALDEPPEQPFRALAELAGLGDRVWWLVGAAVFVLAAAASLEAAMLRGLTDSGGDLVLVEQRLVAVAFLVGAAALVLVAELGVKSLVKSAGRRLETRLRVAFLEKVPRLGDRYFASRPISDMAERQHAVARVRDIASIVEEVAGALVELPLVVVGVFVIYPLGGLLALANAVVVGLVPLLLQRSLEEPDMRVQSHGGALARFYLDAFLGIVPIRTHGGEVAMRREQEGLLTEWVRAGRELVRRTMHIDALQAIASLAISATIVITYAWRDPRPGALLLLLYWVMRLPVLGQTLVVTARQVPAQRNTLLRLLEPLRAKVEVPSAAPAAPAMGPARIALERVHVVAAGQTILEDVSLHVAPGAHVAIVGRSGAGKSSLAGLLLGWHKAALGRVLVDGAPLDGEALARLREEAAWVDPSVHLWDEALLDNLLYGTPASERRAVDVVLARSDLEAPIERLRAGLQTRLGEGGRALSGGEGQRVRLGRALSKAQPRLVVLDEPFRGMARERRQQMLVQLRALWRETTLLCITHDIEEALAFDRVLVVDDGQIVEDGNPRSLARVPGSTFAMMLDEERTMHAEVWANAAWTRARVEGGALREEKAS